MSITVTFDPPLPSDSPSTFNTKAFTLLGDLNDWSTEANALASTVNSNASTSATNASNASNSADAAATSASNTAAIYDAFDDRYLGAKAVAPTLDNDGGALLTGALYFNTASNTMFVYTGSSWVATNASFAAPGPIGGTTPAAGTFTTLTSTGNAALGDAEASDTHAIKGATTLLANSANAALTVTQTGAGNAFVVEDSASTDSSPFVIDTAGLVGVGGASPADHLYVFGAGQTTSALTDAGNRLANLFISASGSSAGDGGSVSLGTLVANGVRQQWALKTLLTDGSANGKSALVISGRADTADTALTERMRIDSAGNVGIGGAPVLGYSIWNAKTLTGGSTAAGQINVGTIQSDVTSVASMFMAQPSTAAASFTLPLLVFYNTYQSTIGAGSTVTTQIGFRAQASMTGATNNYGFYSDIAAASNRYNLYCAGTADNYFAGKLNLGTNGYAGTSFVNGRNVTGSTVASSMTLEGFVQSDVTSLAIGSNVTAQTAAASFTLSNYRLYQAQQGIFGAGSSITSQFGFFADSSLIGATNNYGFCSNIASGTNRYNVYAAGTADNYMAGSLGIGGIPIAGYKLLNYGSWTGSTVYYGISSQGDIQSSVTTQAACYRTAPTTQAASFTLTSLMHYTAEQGTIGAASAVTNQYGFLATSSITGATNNYGFYSNIASAANRYNFYANGTAPNAFSGDVKIFGAGALGYSTGSGGTITQATSRTTGVTLNKTNGQITLFSAAGSATAASFTVTNSTVAATDTIVLSVASGTNKYMVFVTAVAAGSFEITFQTTGGTSTDAPVINFAVIKAVSA